MSNTWIIENLSYWTETTELWASKSRWNCMFPWPTCSHNDKIKKREKMKITSRCLQRREWIRISSTGSEIKLVGNSENSLIFQLACSFSFEKEIRKNRVLESDTLILSSGKAKHGGRDENSFFKKRVKLFLKRWSTEMLGKMGIWIRQIFFSGF